MPDSFSSLFTDLVSPITSFLIELQTTFTAPDYAITVPFDIKSLSYFSSLKAKTLRQTKSRWCWFDKASKDDKEAGTRLGTLRFLPYEIRWQIYQMVLEDYFDEAEEQQEQEMLMLTGGKYTCYGAMDRSKLEVKFHGQYCCCQRGQTPDVFDLGAYLGAGLATKKHPMSLRLASPSIQPEFDCFFLGRRSFHFICPFTLHKFLDQLSPFQQQQLRCIGLSFYLYQLCLSDLSTRRDAWDAACQRLPPGLNSVEMKTPLSLRDVHTFWKTRSRRLRLNQANVKRTAREVLEVLCKKVSRASPRAVVSWTDREGLGKEECDILDAVLAELEPWSEEWHGWIDETHALL